MIPPLPWYLNQVERAQRFLDRIGERTSPSPEAFVAQLGAYQDNPWSFFMNCWHGKDWVKNDDALDQAVRNSVLEAAHRSVALLLCQSIANRVKHMLPRHTRGDAGAVVTYDLTAAGDGTTAVRWDHFIRRDDGSYVTAYEVGCEALREWRRIFGAHALLTPLGWKDP